MVREGQNAYPGLIGQLDQLIRGVFAVRARGVGVEIDISVIHGLASFCPEGRRAPNHAFTFQLAFYHPGERQCKNG